MHAKGGLGGASLEECSRFIQHHIHLPIILQKIYSMDHVLYACACPLASEKSVGIDSHDLVYIFSIHSLIYAAVMHDLEVVDSPITLIVLPNIWLMITPSVPQCCQWIRKPKMIIAPPNVFSSRASHWPAHGLDLIIPLFLHHLCHSCLLHFYFLKSGKESGMAFILCICEAVPAHNLSQTN